jgi:hypothetical protein
MRGITRGCQGVKIDGASLERLTTNFAGQLIQSEDTRHDTARQIWNGHVQRWPALVAGGGVSPM